MHRLRWGVEEDARDLLKHLPPSTGGIPDYIIGSDLLYSADGQEALMVTLQHLCGRNSLVLLCGPSRMGRDEVLLRRCVGFEDEEVCTVCPQLFAIN